MRPLTLATLSSLFGLTALAAPGTPNRRQIEVSEIVGEIITLPGVSVTSPPASTPTFVPDPNYPLVTEQNQAGWDLSKSCSTFSTPDKSTDGRPTACLATGGPPLSLDCVARSCNLFLALSRQENPCLRQTIDTANAHVLDGELFEVGQALTTCTRSCQSCDTGAAIYSSRTGDGVGGWSFPSYISGLTDWCKTPRYCVDLSNGTPVTTGACTPPTTVGGGSSPPVENENGGGSTPGGENPTTLNGGGTTTPLVGDRATPTVPTTSSATPSTPLSVPPTSTTSNLVVLSTQTLSPSAAPTTISTTDSLGRPTVVIQNGLTGSLTAVANTAFASFTPAPTSVSGAGRRGSEGWMMGALIGLVMLL